MASVQVLMRTGQSASMANILNAFCESVRRAGDRLIVTDAYRDTDCKWLALGGVGHPVADAARKAHIARGGRVLHFDHGYFDRAKVVGHMRMSIDQNHPQNWLSSTLPDPSRWDALNIPLRRDYSPEGPAILVGMGRKSRKHLGKLYWEEKMLVWLKEKLPGREIIFRPKGKDLKRLPCRIERKLPIEDVLKGASYVLCHHSNVAVDAIIAGVPFHCFDGAAMWYLQRGLETDEARLDFLRRLAWWQWKSTETDQCWQFVKGIA